MYQNLIPEFIREQIYGYTITAGELLQAEGFDESNKNTNIVLVPTGPDFFTALLKVAGNMLLDKSKKHVSIIYLQDQEPTKILVHHNLGLILGKEIICDTTHFKKSKKYEIIEKLLSEDVMQHVYITRILNNFEKYTVLGIGKEVDDKEIEKIYKKNTEDTVVLIIADLHKEEERVAAIKKDEKIITNILNQQEIDEMPILFKIFIRYSKEKKLTPKLVNYLNTADFGGNKKQTSGYATFFAK